MQPYNTVLILAALSIVMMLLERWGLATTLALTFKGDVKRETRFLAQYGQMICTVVVIVVIYQLDKTRGPRVAEALGAAVLGATIASTILKRLLGRARPKREHAGKFMGPSFRHANYRESFPSSHSASAFAFSGVLVMAYPQAAATFWVLAIICASLRYVMDAHWPSDVLGGISLGLLASIISWHHFF
ncbi:MAG: phosphatase PAP2 family protein [Planctomycetota bacterium]|nr:phosphatase PAP2 family protein [Planctomycetota bacterium]